MKSLDEVTAELRGCTEVAQLIPFMAHILYRLEVLESKLVNEPTHTAKRGRAQNVEEVKLFCAKSGISDGDAEWFWNKMGASGWRNGGKPIRDWEKLLISWRLAGYLASQLQRVVTKSNTYGIKIAMDAKEQEATELKRRHASECAGSTIHWDSEEARQRYLQLRQEYKDLRTRVGASV